MVVVMESITEEEETRIDNSIKYFDNIRHVKKDGTVISSKDIFLYGEVDFENKDDVNNIIKFNFINESIWANNTIYSNFNFDKGCFTTINGIAKQYQTWNALDWFKYKYVLLGKPKRIIVYNKVTNK